jgi:hypothetical protein
MNASAIEALGSSMDEAEEKGHENERAHSSQDIE